MQDLIDRAIRDLVADLPAGWSKAWLRVELQVDGSGGTATAYAVRGAGLATAVAVSLRPEHLLHWRRRRRAMREATDPWLVNTLELTSDGRFDLAYEYEASSTEPPMTRHARWLQAVLSGVKGA